VGARRTSMVYRHRRWEGSEVWQPIRPGGRWGVGRVDTGRARRVDDAPRRPRALGAGRSRFVVTVAAPTNPSGTGRPSSPSMTGIGRQIVIQSGGQQAGSWPARPSSDAPHMFSSEPGVGGLHPSARVGATPFVAI
jgi:hypothetical protein